MFQGFWSFLTDLVSAFVSTFCKRLFIAAGDIIVQMFNERAGQQGAVLTAA